MASAADSTGRDRLECLWHPIWIHTSGVLKQLSAQPDETNAPTASIACRLFCSSLQVDNSASKTAPMRRHLAPDDATQTIVKAAAIVNSANHTAHNCWCAGDFPRWTSHESIPLHEERWASLERHLIPPVCVCIGCNPAGSPAYLTRCV